MYFENKMYFKIRKTETACPFLETRRNAVRLWNFFNFKYVVFYVRWKDVLCDATDKMLLISY